MFETMQNWYLALPVMEQVFWGCAVVASCIMLVQFTLTLLGMDSDVDMDFDFTDGDTMDLGGPLSLFSFRTLVNFFVGFGWAGVSFRGIIANDVLLCVVAVVVGLLFGYVTIFVMRSLRKLEHNAAFRLEECQGVQCDVYLRIPANNEGRGKVQLSHNGSIHEVDAVTDGDAIPTGSRVRIVKVLGSIVKVETV